MSSSNKIKFQDILRLINGLEATNMIVNILQYAILIRIAASKIKLIENDIERDSYSRIMQEYNNVIKGIIAEHANSAIVEEAKLPLLDLQSMVEKYVNECVLSAYAKEKLSAA